MALVETESPWVPSDTFASRLLLVRKHLQLSQEEAARLCGLKPSTWYAWENGAQPRGLADVVVKVAKATGCNRDWLMWGQLARAADVQDYQPALFATEVAESYQESLLDALSVTAA